MLGSQAVLPKFLTSSTQKWQQSSQQSPQSVLCGQLVEDPFNHLRVSIQSTGHKIKNATISEENECLLVKQIARLCLFKLNMPVDGTLEAILNFKCDRSNRTNSAGIYIALACKESETVKYIYIQTSFETQDNLQTMTINLDSTIINARLYEIGVFYEGNFDSTDSRPLFYICNIVIKPKHEFVNSWNIDSVRAIQRQAGSNIEKRLAWKWSGSRDMWPADLPWSNTTGPFSKFVIYVDGKELDESFCTEFPFRQDDPPGQRILDDSDDVEIIVKGALFGGRTVSSSPIRMRKEDIAY